MKILVDMNLSPEWVKPLNGGGLEAFHWSALGPTNAPDEAIMAFAEMHDFIVLTNDLDFGTILAATKQSKPSVVQLRTEDLDHRIIGKRVTSILLKLEAELREGALVTVEDSRTRFRPLPFPRSAD